MYYNMFKLSSRQLQLTLHSVGGFESLWPHAGAAMCYNAIYTCTRYNNTKILVLPTTTTTTTTTTNNNNNDNDNNNNDDNHDDDNNNNDDDNDNSNR